MSCKKSMVQCAYVGHYFDSGNGSRNSDPTHIVPKQLNSNTAESLQSTTYHQQARAFSHRQMLSWVSTCIFKWERDQKSHIPGRTGRQRSIKHCTKLFPFSFSHSCDVFFLSVALPSTSTVSLAIQTHSLSEKSHQNVRWFNSTLKYKYRLPVDVYTLITLLSDRMQLRSLCSIAHSKTPDSSNIKETASVP